MPFWAGKPEGKTQAGGSTILTLIRPSDRSFRPSHHHRHPPLHLLSPSLQALLSQAGFPADGVLASVTITQAQWEEFVGQFQSSLDLLRQISSVWNLEEPCIISGFDMDRQGTVQVRGYTGDGRQGEEGGETRKVGRGEMEGRRRK